MDIQKFLDEKLAENPEAQKYVEKLWYIPHGEAPPPEVTHTIRLSSVQSPVQREITVGLVVKPPYAAALDALLATAATQPRQ
jgi:hypothetical protein